MLLVALLCAGIATFAQLYSAQGILPLIASSLRVSAAQSALLISAATIGLAAGAVPWAWLAGRIGSLNAMRLSLTAATALGTIGAILPGFDLILALRVLEGVALGGVPALAIAYLHRQVSPAASAVAAGVYVSGTTIGGLAGRVIAAPIAEWLGWRAGVGVVLALAAVATVVFTVVAPPEHPRHSRRAMFSGTEQPRTLRTLLTPDLLALYGQGFLLMGGFVAVYNYLAFRLQGAPFGLNTAVTSMLFFAYLAGTFSSRQAGAITGRYGRLRVLTGSIAVFVAGVLLTIASLLPIIILGSVVLTAGFFAAHAVASGWAGARNAAARTQGPALYNVAYYAGSSAMGWFGGVVFARLGWTGLAGLTITLAAAAVLLAALTLRGPETVD